MDSMMTVLERLKLNITDFITEFGMNILIALVIFLIGNKVIKYLVVLISKFFEKSKVDLSLSKFLVSASRIVLKGLLIVIVLSTIDVDTAPIIALIGATGIGVGMALQGSLGNMTGGILILLLRPFNVGDYIEEQAFSHEGIVEDIHVFYTTLRTRDNKLITIPNGALSNNSIINYTALELRRVDLTFGVAYEEDNDQVKKAIRSVTDRHPDILKEPEQYINISEHGDSSVNYAVLVWCKTENYLKVKYDLIEQIKLKFDEENISIPYPHMDVNITNVKEQITKN